MEKSFETEVKGYWSELKLLTILCHFIPIMEVVDKLSSVVKKRNNELKKTDNDLKYWLHELELMDMQQRVIDNLMKKKYGNAQ